MSEGTGSGSGYFRLTARKLLLGALLLTGILVFAFQDRGLAEADLAVVDSEAARFRLEVMAEGLEIAWAMDFLPGGRAIYTERDAGSLSIINLETKAVTRLTGLPKLGRGVTRGMLDVLVHPDFASNGWIYFSYSYGTTKRSTLVVDRAQIQGSRLVNIERLFEALPWYHEDNHYGDRLALKDGYLFITMGERYDLKEKAQDLGTHLGKILRIHEDGRVPEDNPFKDVAGALPEVWSYGHRNPQGLTLHPTTGELWEHEHGPQGGDEINIIRPGKNYGWPVITYGEEYGGGPIGEGITEKPGMEQPLYYYVPSIAPSGMSFYTGDQFPGWKGNLFIGAMALTHLNRLVLKDGKVVHEERLLDDRDWRVRFVTEGPEGFLYIGIDDGMILRLRPE